MDIALTIVYGDGILCRISNNNFKRIKEMMAIKKLKILIGLTLTAMLISGCSTKEVVTDVSPDIKELVHYYSTEDAGNESAIITSEHLIVKTDNTEEKYNLPEDEFFVSIAPFIEQTHPCKIHSLTGCQSELVNQKFNVVITDTKGKEVINGVLESFENGFIDIWLPRNETYKITIEHEGKSAEAELTTFKDSNTCITTMQLK